jgi:very-short-patch-repair endonuclease
MRGWRLMRGVHVIRAKPDLIIARIAARQHGVVTVEQLLAAGMTPDAIAWGVAVGRLHRIHRGVYAVGHAGLTARGRWKAATLALGVGAVLSHRSAAELWAMLPERGGAPHVTVPGNAGRRNRRAIRVHRSVSLAPALTTSRDGIAVTRPTRTLADLRRVAGPTEVRRARRQAEFLGLPLDEDHGSDRTRSDLERDFLALCRRAKIPDPEVNVRVGPYTVDFLWRDERLAVETDGYGAHRGWQAFTDDRVRDAHLARLGIYVQRFSDWQLENEPAEVVATVSARLDGR